MILQTDRLILRPWTLEDAPFVYKYASNPKVALATGWQPHPDLEASEQIVQNILMISGTYAVTLKTTGEPIGSISLKGPSDSDLTDAEGEGEIGFWLGEPHWGKGYIPEATQEILRHGFVNLGLERIWCAYFDDNANSNKVQEKCGFVFHHIRKEFYAKQLGQIKKLIVNCLDREDWLKTHKNSI